LCSTPASAGDGGGGKGCLSDNELPTGSSSIDCPASAGQGRFKADTSQHPRVSNTQTNVWVLYSIGLQAI